MRGLFVTGTDTGVGKTHIAAAIAASLTRSGRRVGVLKPVATGVETDGLCEDGEALRAAVGGAVPVERVAPLRYRAPLAPPVAARLEGSELTSEQLGLAIRQAWNWWQGQNAQGIVIEGVGGFLCPLTETATVADLACDLGLPILIVARRGLGTLGHTLLTVEAAQRRGLDILGVILNGSEPTRDPLAEATNRAELARWLGPVGVLAEIPHGTGGEAFRACIDLLEWWDRMQPPRGGFFNERTD